MDIESKLVDDLLLIFESALEKEVKLSDAKHRIFTWFHQENDLIQNPDYTSVKIEDLKKWLEKIKAHNTMKAELETDIGYVATALNNLTGIKNPMPTLMKLISGSLKPAELGLDMDRIQAIAEKYAPVTCAELKKKEAEKTKK